MCYLEPYKIFINDTIYCDHLNIAAINIAFLIVGIVVALFSLCLIITKCCETQQDLASLNRKGQDWGFEIMLIITVFIFIGLAPFGVTLLIVMAGCLVTFVVFLASATVYTWMTRNPKQEVKIAIP